MTHGHPDPALIDRPVTAEIEVPPPSFIEIALAAVMAGFLIYATWSGLLF